MARYRPGGVVVIENIPYLIKKTSFTGDKCCERCARHRMSCESFIDPFTGKITSCAVLFGDNTCLKKLKGGV